MPEIKDATEETISDLVTSSDRPVVVDFWATWCGPCRQVAPELEKLAEKYEGRVDVLKVDVDANPTLARSFDIMSIPTIAYFAPGKKPQSVAGFRKLEDLERIFDLEAA
jgi:thioredoxin 1